MLSLLSLLSLTSAQAANFEIYYQANLDSSGKYIYDFRMIQAVSGTGYALGWLIVGDYAGTSGAGTCSTGTALINAALVGPAPGPWTSLTSSSGGHNGPTFSGVLDQWKPVGQGDWIDWQFQADNNISYSSPFFWSTIYGSTYNCIQLLEGDPDLDGIWDGFCSHAPLGDDADKDGDIDICDYCPDDYLNDSDKDGSCDSDDLCLGFDDNIDTDLDLVPDGCDLCVGDDFSGDLDADGQCALYGGNPWDCDDNDATSAPGAEEQCDGVDNDCDGVLGVDEADDDADGVLVCENDCDDSNADVFEGAVELCDGLDNDCDGAPGDDELDADADGLAACAGDCDDADSTASPDLAEACDDGVDNNCDGSVDEGCDVAGGDDTGGTGGTGDDETDGGKTGCSTLGMSGGLWALALSGLALLRRRQRPLR